ncbi:MAG: flagellar biosynthesis anti-sigma factor FlgM [Terracidiphilus sp.]|jgi:flagellar biosynthesis anti-sigma factor FlgM
MRIDSLNSTATELSSELSSQQVGAQKAAQSGQADAGDRTTLSSDSTSVDSLVSQALSFPEVRQSTVDSLRLSVTSGQYELDPAKIASSMLDEQA